jgi:hypothetical protein
VAGAKDTIPGRNLKPENSMNRFLSAAALAAVLTGPAGAATLDPDSFADGTDISTAVAGVTLSTVFAGSGDPANPANITGTGAVFAVNSSATSTGTRGFAHSNRSTAWGNGIFEYLRIDFASVMSSVSLDFINNDSSDSNAQLLGFDSGGNLISDILFAGPLTGSQTLTVTGAISTVFAYWDERNRRDNGGLDNLQYTAAVPVPAALPLMLLGLGAMGAVARRRKTAA